MEGEMRVGDRRLRDRRIEHNDAVTPIGELQLEITVVADPETQQSGALRYDVREHIAAVAIRPDALFSNIDVIRSQPGQGLQDLGRFAHDPPATGTFLLGTFLL